MNKAEVAAGDPNDRGDGLGVGEVGVIEIEAELPPVPGENKCQFLVLQGPLASSRSGRLI